MESLAPIGIAEMAFPALQQQSNARGKAAAGGIGRSGLAVHAIRHAVTAADRSAMDRHDSRSSGAARYASARVAAAPLLRSKRLDQRDAAEVAVATP
jgi:hypothetical protein